MKFTFKRLVVLSLLIISAVGGFWGCKLYTTPGNMRYATSWPHPIRLAKDFKRCISISHTGLENAKFSGSGSLPLNHLDKLKKTLGPNLIVINGLPGEVWHINGRHIRQLCYNYDGNKLTPHKQRQGFQCKVRQFLAGVPSTADQVPTHLIQAQSTHMDNSRIPYLAPLSENWTSQWDYVDDLLEVFDSIDPAQDHLHFHCEYGKGRTTTLMALYDTYLNGRDVSIEDIIDRQYCLGGEDLDSTIVFKKGTWTQDALVDRKNLIYAFYDYINDPDGQGQQKWSTWLKQQEVKGYTHLPIGNKESLPHRTDDRI